MSRQKYPCRCCSRNKRGCGSRHRMCSAWFAWVHKFWTELPAAAENLRHNVPEQKTEPEWLRILVRRGGFAK